MTGGPALSVELRIAAALLERIKQVHVAATEGKRGDRANQLTTLQYIEELTDDDTIADLIELVKLDHHLDQRNT